VDYPEGWKEQGGYLIRVFEFENFVKAVEFVNEIVPIAEEMEHHPDLEVFSYNKVMVKLTTHDEGNHITEKDLVLAKKIDGV
jgi:4a-hydroxytetrahydrobiopterin dehydratase